MLDAPLLHLLMMSTFSSRDYKDGIILAADDLGPRHQERARRGSSSPPRPPSPLLPGLCPGRRALRPGRAAAAFPAVASAAAAADRGRPVAAGSPCE